MRVVTLNSILTYDYNTNTKLKLRYLAPNLIYKYKNCSVQYERMSGTNTIIMPKPAPGTYIRTWCRYNAGTGTVQHLQLINTCTVELYLYRASWPPVSVELYIIPVLVGNLPYRNSVI